MKCKDCMYFGEEVIHVESMHTRQDTKTSKTGYHVCGGVEHFGGLHSDIRRQGLAVLVDADGSYAELRVRPDFGCAVFVSKYGVGE